LNPYLYDEALRKEGFGRIAGIDEAGRGPVAGPVVAGAVVLPEGERFDGLKDSKLLPEKKIREIFFALLARAPDIGIGLADAAAIERMGILRATKLAMEAAIKGLSSPPDLLLIDAVELPGVGIKQVSMIKGESKSASIAAASIVAKFTRDRIMGYFHGLYPDYGFLKHKGYCTEGHVRAIRLHGPCPIHRKGWRKVMSLTLPF